ncbi:MAG: VWA domain-containing protein [Fibrobacteria bacterium]|nr:VWA domain-containing protein [Fibrobacteria bacterium]
MDIVYVVDQTISMKPTEITIEGKDTVGWYECNRFDSLPEITTIGSIDSFHGLRVNVIDPKFSNSEVGSVCAMAGDPYSVRGIAVQEAIKAQANEAPASYAATINFAGKIVSTQNSMTELADTSAFSKLMNSVQLTYASGTHYEEPLAWARILLEGGHTEGSVVPSTMPASRNAQKAIILISDGKPNKSWIKGLEDTATAVLDGIVWKTDDPTTPPVYGIYLGIDTSAGTLLDSVSRLTNGRFYMISPNKPDSLAAVVQNILGQLIAATKPEGARVRNITNGQYSEARSSIVNGISYKMVLDSLIGLESGMNNLSISTSQGGSPVRMNLNILVSDAPTNSVSPLDSILTTRCYSPSTLTVKPDVSGLPWADSVDRNLLVSLLNVPDQYESLPIRASTFLSGDDESFALRVPTGTSGYSQNTFMEPLPWRWLVATGGEAGDDTLRSGPGWDTAIFKFTMPRDSRDTAVARIALRHSLPPPQGPDSVVYFDADGDGALDRVKVHMKNPAPEGSEIKLPWPAQGTFLDVSRAKTTWSSDSLVVTYDFGPQSPDTTTPITHLVSVWRASPVLPWSDVSVVEHIAPVPMEAVLRRGESVDTLRVSSSEGINPLLMETNTLVARVKAGGAQELAPISAFLDSVEGTLVLLFPAPTSRYQVVPGDSVRFLSSVLDVLGNAPGKTAKKVVVKGTDPIPRDAVLEDQDGDGRGDRIVVRLRFPLTVTDSMGFLWPNRDGVLEERRLPVSAASTDSNGLRLTFPVAPYSFGATSCPAVGCANLGWMSSDRFDASTREFFELRDGVDPVPLRAEYRFAQESNQRDSLVVTFSEPMRAGNADRWVSTGKPSDGPLGAAVINRVQPIWIETNQSALLVDSTDKIEVSDSLRIAYAGALSDGSGNTPDSIAFWTPILWGQPPPEIRVGVPHAVVKNREELVPPAGEAAITVMLRNPKENRWTNPEGSMPEGIETRFGGPLVRLNRIPKSLWLYVYDNLGVVVLNKEITGLGDAEARGLLKRTRRGEYEIWLAWNTLDEKGNPVGSGVYTFRVFGMMEEDGKTIVVNKLITEGIYRHRR